MTASIELILASSSPRRRELLEAAGWRPRVIPPEVDDGRLQPGPVTPERWVMSLAYLKARQVSDGLIRRGEDSPGTIVLGADTICAHGDALYGQPVSEDEARKMIESMRNATHRTVTGVALIHPTTGRRVLHSDATTVRVGDVLDDEVSAYIASGDWRGKARGYNLKERQEAGWSIEVVGDPTTVMGLPMLRLGGWLQHFERSLDIVDEALSKAQTSTQGWPH